MAALPDSPHADGCISVMVRDFGRRGAPPLPA